MRVHIASCEGRSTSPSEFTYGCPLHISSRSAPCADGRSSTVSVQSKLGWFTSAIASCSFTRATAHASASRVVAKVPPPIVAREQIALTCTGFPAPIVVTSSPGIITNPGRCSAR